MRRTTMLAATMLTLVVALGGAAWAATVQCPGSPDGFFASCFGTEEADVINGSPDPDDIRAGGGGDVLYGRAGDDLLLGGFGRDTLRGGSGEDTLNGQEGPDTERGGPGPDFKITSSGGDGNDRVFGGEGDDWLSVYSDQAEYEPGRDVDLLDCGPGNDTGIVNRGIDTVRNCEELSFEED